MEMTAEQTRVGIREGEVIKDSGIAGGKSQPRMIGLKDTYRWRQTVEEWWIAPENAMGLELRREATCGGLSFLRRGAADPMCSSSSSSSSSGVLSLDSKHS